MISTTVLFKEKCYGCGKKVSLSLLTWSEQKDNIEDRRGRCSSCQTDYMKVKSEEPDLKVSFDDKDQEIIFEVMGVESLEELFA